MATDLPANNVPEDLATQARPRLIELCFQVSGLWEAGRDGRLALPTHIDRALVLPADDAAGGPLVASARAGEAGFDCVVQDPTGTVLVRLEGYRTVVLPQPLPDEVQAPLRSVMAD